MLENIQKLVQKVEVFALWNNNDCMYLEGGTH